MKLFNYSFGSLFEHFNYNLHTDLPQRLVQNKARHCEIKDKRCIFFTNKTFIVMIWIFCLILLIVIIGWIIKSFQKANGLVLVTLKQNVYDCQRLFLKSGYCARIIAFLILLCIVRRKTA